MSDRYVSPILKRYLPILVQDFAPDSTALQAKVASYLDNPPTDEEVIGFYGTGEESADVRVVQATITLLEAEDILMSFEDKYIYEIVDVFAQESIIEHAMAERIMRDFLGDSYKFYTGEEEEFDDEEPAEEELLRIYKGYVQRFPDFTRNLTSAVEADGQRLIQFQVPLGDSLIYAIVSSAFADKWLGTLITENDYSFGDFAIIEPDWNQFWSFLEYARKMDVASKYKRQPTAVSAPIPLTEKFGG